MTIRGPLFRVPTTRCSLWRRSLSRMDGADISFEMSVSLDCQVGIYAQLSGYSVPSENERS